MALPSITSFPPRHNRAAPLASPLPLLMETPAPEGSQVSLILLHLIFKKSYFWRTLWGKHFGENLCHHSGSQQQRWPANPLLTSPMVEGARLPRVAWEASPALAGEGWKTFLTQYCVPPHGLVMNTWRQTPSDGLKRVFLMRTGSMFPYRTNPSPAAVEQRDGDGGRRVSEEPVSAPGSAHPPQSPQPSTLPIWQLA